MIPSPVLLGACSPFSLASRQVVILLPNLLEYLHTWNILHFSRHLWLLQGVQQMHPICPDLLRQGRPLTFCFGQAIVLHPMAVAIQPVSADLSN